MRDRAITLKKRLLLLVLVLLTDMDLFESEHGEITIGERPPQKMMDLKVRRRMVDCSRSDLLQHTESLRLDHRARYLRVHFATEPLRLPKIELFKMNVTSRHS
jgi:hypothetical protein